MRYQYLNYGRRRRIPQSADMADLENGRKKTIFHAVTQTKTRNFWGVAMTQRGSTWTVKV